MDRAERRRLAAQKKKLILRMFNQELERDSKRIITPGFRWSGPQYNTDEKAGLLLRRYMRDEGRFWRSFENRGCTCWYCVGSLNIEENREKDRAQDEIIDYLSWGLEEDII